MNNQVSLKTVLLCFLLLSLMFACEKDEDDVPPCPIKNTTLVSNLKLDVSVNIESGFVGDEVIFTINLMNEGPAKAHEIVVKDQLPSGYNFIAYTAPIPESYDALSGEWKILKIDSGSSMNLTITASLDAVGDYINSAEIIASDNHDPNSTPNNNDPLEDDQDTAFVQLRTIQVTTYASLFAADGLAMDATGNLFATNYGQSKVYKIGTDQNVSEFMSNQPGAAGMVFDNQGIMFLARYNNADIVRVNSIGNLLNVFTTGVGGTISLDFDSQGFLYTNNNYNNVLTKMDQLGNKTGIITSVFNNSSLTLDDNDNIYVSDYDSGIIKKLEQNTFNESVFVELPVINGGIGFIIYSHGYFFASAIADNVIFMIDQNGNYEIIAGIEGVAGTTNGIGEVATFDGPNGMVTSHDGKTLFVAQLGTVGAIRKITGYRD